ncbi:MAG: abortive phage infection protein [Candidatus Competibacteraceae bacterium]|nr:MAG: abortive phage infection protein [Candidatus Competibacteraceae bacterium]
MELIDFLRQTQAEVRERINNPDSASPYEELVFTEIVMQHMADIGMTFDEPAICHHEARFGNAILRLSGYALSDDTDQLDLQLDLFASLYSGTDELKTIADSETKKAAEQCLRFLKGCAEGKLLKTMDESSDAYALAISIKKCYPTLDQIRIYVLTDQQATTKNFQSREIGGKTIKLEVMDIERLHRHWSEGKPRDEITVNFKDVAGSSLPCIYVPGEMSDYDYALTVIPGEVLRFVYEKYGDRLLEANVRSFLNATGKVNRGIRDTLIKNPEHFMAYNNGIVILADEIKLETAAGGLPGILWMGGMQIVNGGQTTASIYFTKKKEPKTDLKRVRIPAKIIILRSDDTEAEEDMISAVSRYANSQNAVRLDDIFTNHSFHVEIEKLANTTYCPDGTSRWFYERAAGSYKTLLAREGTTRAKLRQITEKIPSSHKFTKTDLAKFLMSWNQKPDQVSLGSQKCFFAFMNSLADKKSPWLQQPDVLFYKRMIAKTILFKVAQKLVRPAFKAFQANVTTYLVALISHRLGNRIDLDRIWQQQDLSSRLKQQMQAWAPEVNRVLHQSASGKMVSEWAKKAECWEAVLKGSYSQVLDGIPEVKPANCGVSSVPAGVVFGVGETWPEEINL